jgi:hypothetical protein
MKRAYICDKIPLCSFVPIVEKRNMNMNKEKDG